MQHDAFSWEVKGRDFVYLPELKDEALFMDKTTKRVLEKMSLEQRKNFPTQVVRGSLFILKAGPSWWFCSYN